MTAPAQASRHQGPVMPEGATGCQAGRFYWICRLCQSDELLPEGLLPRPRSSGASGHCATRRQIR
jgi:hypothetical protein